MMVLGLVPEQRLVDLHDDVAAAEGHRVGQQVRRTDLTQKQKVLLYALPRHLSNVTTR